MRMDLFNASLPFEHCFVLSAIVYERLGTALTWQEGSTSWNVEDGRDQKHHTAALNLLG